MSCAAVLAVADDTRITATQFRVFALIAKGYCKRADMAEKTGKTVVTIARAIDALLKLRLIERKIVRGKPSKLWVSGNIIAATRIMGDAATRIADDTSDETSIIDDTATRISDGRSITHDTGPAVDNASSACIGTGARAETPINLTTELDKIRSDLIVPVSKERLEGLIERVGAACDPTAPSLHHAADLNRLLRAGCDWDEDILPAVDKLAASFRRSGKRFKTWDLLSEHALEFRDRRVAGLPPPAPVPFRAKRTNGYGRQHVNGITPLAYTG